MSVTTQFDDTRPIKSLRKWLEAYTVSNAELQLKMAVA